MGGRPHDKTVSQNVLTHCHSCLQDNEIVKCLHRKHWSAFLPWLVSFVPAWFIALVLGFNPMFGVLLCLGIAVVQYFSHEYVVTDRRVLLHEGILNRAINDKELRSIKDVSLQIDWLDGLLGRGTVTLAGTGGEAITLKHLADPEGFRNAIREAQHAQA